jgi:hypothetical protein
MVIIGWLPFLSESGEINESGYGAVRSNRLTVTAPPRALVA